MLSLAATNLPAFASLYYSPSLTSLIPFIPPYLPPYQSSLSLSLPSTRAPAHLLPHALATFPSFIMVSDLHRGIWRRCFML